MSTATYSVEVADVGAFVFRRRTARLQIGIEAETNRILGGPADQVSSNLVAVARALAELGALTVEAPKGWPDPGEVEPFDEDAIGKVFLVHGRMLKEEATFRRGDKPAGA